MKKGRALATTHCTKHYSFNSHDLPTYDDFVDFPSVDAFLEDYACITPQPFSGRTVNGSYRIYAEESDRLCSKRETACATCPLHNPPANSELFPCSPHVQHHYQTIKEISVTSSQAPSMSHHSTSSHHVVVRDVRCCDHPAELNIHLPGFSSNDSRHRFSVPRISGVRETIKGKFTLRLLLAVSSQLIRGQSPSVIADGYNFSRSEAYERRNIICTAAKDKRTDNWLLALRDNFREGDRPDAVKYISDTFFLCKKEYVAILEVPPAKGKRAESSLKLVAVFPKDEYQKAFSEFNSLVSESDPVSDMIFYRSIGTSYAKKLTPGLFPHAKKYNYPADIGSLLLDLLDAAADYISTRVSYDVQSCFSVGLFDSFRSALMDFTAPHMSAAEIAAQLDALCEKVRAELTPDPCEEAAAVLQAANLLQNRISALPLSGQPSPGAVGHIQEKTNEPSENTFLPRYEASQNHRHEAQAFLKRLQTALEESPLLLTTEERIDLLLHLNEAVIPQHLTDRGDLRFPFDDDANLEQKSLIGYGIPIHCADHLLQCGLLQENRRTIPCVSQKAEMGICQGYSCPYRATKKDDSILL